MVFFFNDTATTEIYTLSLHDALPIFSRADAGKFGTWADDAARLLMSGQLPTDEWVRAAESFVSMQHRSEEHTSELQSRQYLVCRLLLEKKKKTLLFITTEPFTPLVPP